MKPLDPGQIDVAVIGGGIAGLACAHELAGAGRKVALFEGAVGRAAAWAAAGMLSPWAEGDESAGADRGSSAGPTALEMREASLHLYPGWVAAVQTETGREIEMRRCGSLVVSLQGEIPALERLASVARRAPGFRELTAEQARVEAPLLGASIQDAVLLPEEGYADPRSILPALQEACRLRGVALLEEAVMGLIEDSGGVRGVVTATGDVPSATVLNAGGSWASPFLDREEIRPVRGQVLVLTPPRGAPRPRRVIQSGKVYLVPRKDGSIIAGATSEEAGLDPSVTEAATRILLERAASVAPSLAGWALREARAGLRPHRVGGPLIGPDRRRPGLYHVAGLYRHGILLAPYAAARIRDCIG